MKPETDNFRGRIRADCDLGKRKRVPLRTAQHSYALAVRMRDSKTSGSGRWKRTLPYSLGRRASCTWADNLFALCRRRVTCHISSSVSFPPNEGIALKRIPFFITQ
jgi:hypothetical protein